MKNYKKTNNIIGWLVFLIATSVYLFTIEPTASWWDCGEYISTAFKLQVGHPPGAPFFQLIGRFFTLFAFGNTLQVAKMINIMSALSSSFTILFLFWTITALTKKIALKQGELSKAQAYIIFGSGIIGALAYTFSDSFWFSAVEGEVYAMSSFFTAFVFWAILKWDEVADEKKSTRWLVLIAYLIGLSIGVHLLNLLAIPAIALVFYFRKYKPSLKGIIITAIVSILILAFIMYGIIPEIVNLFAKTELIFVNSFGLPFNTGTVFFTLVLIGFIVFGLLFTGKNDTKKIISTVFIILSSILVLIILIGSSSAGNFFIRLIISSSLSFFFYKLLNNKAILNSVLLGFTFLLIGYSSFLLIIIRSNTNTPINENSPKDAISLLSYLNREQYGERPLFYGPYYNAPQDQENPYLDGNPIYVKDNKKGKYIITDDKKSTIPNYDSRFCTIFPRMWSSQKKNHIRAYKNWTGKDGIPITVNNNDGTTKTIVKPSFGQNLKFFFNYQIGHMYVRYFMWNFVGRQNNIEEGNFSVKNGNWISGINFIDKMKVGDQKNLPESMKNPAHNTFYFLPLILGLIGLFYHIKKSPNESLVVAFLFIMTGLAIVVYLNQYPYQPRERDYAYAASFYAFAIWIGIGVLGIFNIFKNKHKTPLTAILISAICLVLVPGIMAQQGWDDHDRSGKYATRDFAANYLNSCEPNAILFTNGDNDTFPLWYAQEVEGIRTDIRIVNFMLASGDWYIHQLAKKVYDSDALLFTLKPEQYNKGINEIIPYINRNITGYFELKDVVDFIANENIKLPIAENKKINFIPTKKLKLTIDSATIVNNGIVPKNMADKIVKEIKWDLGTNYIYKNGLMLLDLIATNNWKRPIYFANPSTISQYLDIDKYCHLEGIVYKFMPLEAKTGYLKTRGGISIDKSYDILMNKCKWGNLNSPDVTIDRESFRNSFMPKQNYLRLADALLEVNKNDSATAVLDKCLEFFPCEKFSYDVFMIPFVEAYYKAGATDKANALAEKMADIYDENIRYINSLSNNIASGYSDDIQQGFGILQRLSQLSKQYKQDELHKKIDGLFNANLEFLK